MSDQMDAPSTNSEQSGDGIAKTAVEVTAGIDTPTYTLRYNGEELSNACEDCIDELECASEFDSKFLVLDKWMRIFDGEPLPPEMLVGKRFGKAEDKDSEDKISEETSVEVQTPAEGDKASEGDTASPEKKKTIEVKRFAKYKRLKEALKLYDERFGEDSFKSLVPLILQAVVKAVGKPLPGCQEIAKSAPASEASVSLTAAEALVLMAHRFLLNTPRFSDLQKLYLSSARAAPQKLLCLLIYFRVMLREASDDQVLFFQRAKATDAMSEVIIARRGEDDKAPPPPLLAATASFASDFQRCLERDAAGLRPFVLCLSNPSSFGIAFDVKTPPEEVPVWEAPELLCARLLLGSNPLAEDEVFVVSGIRHISRCCVEGPLLSLGSVMESTSFLSVSALDLSRHMDDRRFAVSTLQRDGAKFVSAFKCLSKLTGNAPVALIHPPLLGVDRHLAYASALFGASCGIACEAEKGVQMLYALCGDYCTGSNSAREGEEASEGALSPAQTKEAKHFEALSNRMRAAVWTSQDLLRLLTLYPFGRANSGERFHAFWTRRLRDKSTLGGRLSEEELDSVLSRQEELWPPPPQPENLDSEGDKEKVKSRSRSPRNREAVQTFDNDSPNTKQEGQSRSKHHSRSRSPVDTKKVE